MNIIPQEIINEAKNLIKNKFLYEIRNLLKEFTDEVFLSFSNYKYTTLILNFHKKISDLIIKVITYSAKIIDKLFSESEYRKKNFYISKKSVPRTIVDYHGTIYIERNYYVNKDKQSGFFMVDNVFGFEKYKTYTQLVRSLLIKESVCTNVNKACNNTLIYNTNILDCLKSDSNLPSIPRQTVYNWINNLLQPKVAYEQKENKNVLYVMADEKWIHEQIRKSKLNDDDKNKKHYIMTKCFVIFTGAKTKNNRTKLLNRHVFITSSKHPWKELMDEICTIYDFEKVETINLLSDAGNWILSGASELNLYSHNKIIINTCEFHVLQKINRMTNNEELRNKLINVIYNEKDKNKFRNIVNKLIEEKPNRIDKINEYKDYIIKHWNSILNMSTCEIKSSMESHISHCVAEHFGSRPKGYSKDRIENYLKLEECKQNGINILDLILKLIGKKKGEIYKYNEKEVNFAMFNKNTSLLPTYATINPISIVLNKIAYN